VIRQIFEDGTVSYSIRRQSAEYLYTNSEGHNVLSSPLTFFETMSISERPRIMER
jgi:hypothetical protein